MSFVDVEDTRVLYLSARPKRGCDKNVVKIFADMTDLCNEMYNRKADYTIRPELGSRKKLSIFFLFESKEHKQAYTESERYQELMVDLEFFCKPDKLFTATQIQATIVKAPKALVRTGMKILSIEEIHRNK